MILVVVLAVAVALIALHVVGVKRTARVETVDWKDLQPAPGAKFVTTRLGRIHYVDVGQGPPILLMHGSGRSIADWEEGAIERLAVHHRVVAFDYFGNGFSERNPDFVYGYDLWVDEAVELLAALSIPHVTLIGHSVGGALACILAADHPDVVDHVVTIGTGMTIEPQQFLPLVPGVGELMLANAATFGPTHSSRQRAALEAAYRVKGTRAAVLQYIRRQLTVDGFRLVWGTFEDVAAPVLHLSGSLDANIPPSVARDLARRTHGKFVSIEGATHMVPIEAPDRLAEEVERFLAETPVDPARPADPRALLPVDSVVGIGTGLLARVVAAEPPLDPSVAATVVDRYWLARFTPPVGPLVALADLAWLAAIAAAAFALRAGGAPRSVFTLLVVAGVAFGIDHPSPTGTIGMLALFAANLILYRRGLLAGVQSPRREAASAA